MRSLIFKKGNKMREFFEKLEEKTRKLKLINWCFKIYLKYFEIWNYLICGGISTVVNVLCFAITENVLNWNNVTLSTAFAWLVAVVIAYILNKIFVFETNGLTKKELFKEIISFLVFRLLSGVLDIGFMKLTVDVLHFEKVLMKIISNIIVVILNYIFSKFIIFKKD